MRPLLIQLVFVFTSLVPSSQLSQSWCKCSRFFICILDRQHRLQKSPFPAPIPVLSIKQSCLGNVSYVYGRALDNLQGILIPHFFIRHTRILSHHDSLSIWTWRSLKVSTSVALKHCWPFPDSGAEDDSGFPRPAKRLAVSSMWLFGIYGQFVPLDSGS